MTAKEILSTIFPKMLSKGGKEMTKKRFFYHEKLSDSNSPDSS